MAKEERKEGWNVLLRASRLGVNLDEDDRSTSRLLEDLWERKRKMVVRVRGAAIQGGNRSSLDEFTAYLNLESRDVLSLNPRDEEIDSLLLQAVGVPFRVKG